MSNSSISDTLAVNVDLQNEINYYAELIRKHKESQPRITYDGRSGKRPYSSSLLVKHRLAAPQNSAGNTVSLEKHTFITSRNNKSHSSTRRTVFPLETKRLIMPLGSSVVLPKSDACCDDSKSRGRRSRQVLAASRQYDKPSTSVQQPLGKLSLQNSANPTQMKLSRKLPPLSKYCWVPSLNPTRTTEPKQLPRRQIFSTQETLEKSHLGSLHNNMRTISVQQQQCLAGTLQLSSTTRNEADEQNPQQKHRSGQGATSLPGSFSATQQQCVTIQQQSTDTSCATVHSSQQLALATITDNSCSPYIKKTRYKVEKRGPRAATKPLANGVQDLQASNSNLWYTGRIRPQAQQSDPYQSALAAQNNTPLSPNVPEVAGFQLSRSGKRLVSRYKIIRRQASYLSSKQSQSGSLLDLSQNSSSHASPYKKDNRARSSKRPVFSNATRLGKRPFGARGRCNNPYTPSRRRGGSNPYRFVQRSDVKNSYKHVTQSDLRNPYTLVRRGDMRSTYNFARRGDVKTFVSASHLIRKFPFKVSTEKSQSRSYPHPRHPTVALSANSSWLQSHASRVLYRSAAVSAHAKYRKNLTNEKHCIFFMRFGKCKRGDNCYYVHDPERVAVCTRFLRGTCSIEKCPFSHNPRKEKVPVCQHFLRGCCLRDTCPYLHVNVGKNAPVCHNFAAFRFCPLGEKCKKLHTDVCPDVDEAGKCGKKECRLRHIRPRKRITLKTLEKEPNCNTGPLEKIEEPVVPKGERLTQALPAYISLGQCYRSSDEACAVPAKRLKTKPDFLSKTYL